jgi:cytochrome c-type biogenesis protein CcmH/NrfG
VTETGRDLARAQAMVAVKRHDEATRLLGRIVAAQPENGRAWCLLATAHLGSGRYQDAADAAKQAGVAARRMTGRTAW